MFLTKNILQAENALKIPIIKQAKTLTTKAEQIYIDIYIHSVCTDANLPPSPLLGILFILFFSKGGA